MMDRFQPLLSISTCAATTWAQHVLEAPRSWIMSMVYIVVTVTLGYPLVSGVAAACGVTVVWVGRCRLTVSNPELKAPVGSALETKT